MSETIGAISPKSRYLLHEILSTATAESSNDKYELLLINGHTPSVRSCQTGKVFIVSWPGLIGAARESGIDHLD